MDIDGQAAFSRIIAIDNRVVHTLTAYPNPASDRLRIDLAEKTNSQPLVRAFSTDGRIVFEDKTERLSDGHVYISVKAIPAGLYQVQIVNAASTYQAQVVKG
ncbi:T9SS type A sorting domain-containing protein [Dyadobacter sp. OTU695]|uniref:T9SS type A sorting domain-containing protein n=1 Tax=Dyadobacter sp. OTU695 TaxID=3043860 RepID=UPI00313D7FEE